MYIYIYIYLRVFVSAKEQKEIAVTAFVVAETYETGRTLVEAEKLPSRKT